MIRLILAGLALVLVALVGFVGYRTLSFTASPPPAEAAVPDLAAYAIDTEAAANRLAQAIGFPTVSLVSESDDRAPFAALHAWLQQTYPAFHAVAKREVFGEFSLLYTWAGSDPAQPRSCSPRIWTWCPPPQIRWKTGTPRRFRPSSAMAISRGAAPLMIKARSWR
ncbi:MAG: hypothetical protein NVV62_17730 [Terricaulis sp.]|nr:hypothetical protein [Terricaulis sp.]